MFAFVNNLSLCLWLFLSGIRCRSGKQRAGWRDHWSQCAFAGREGDLERWKWRARHHHQVMESFWKKTMFWEKPLNWQKFRFSGKKRT